LVRIILDASGASEKNAPDELGVSPVMASTFTSSLSSS